jgi:hypothetical protein
VNWELLETSSLWNRTGGLIQPVNQNDVIQTDSGLKVGPSGTPTIELNADGSATFAGKVGVGSTSTPPDDFSVTSTAGRTTLSLNADSGQDTRLSFKRSNTYRFNFVNDSTDNFSIQNSSFNSIISFNTAGTVGIGGTLPSAPNIELKADGSAEFGGGGFTISSGGKITQNLPSGSTGTALDLQNDGTSVFQVLPSGYTKIGGGNIELNADGSIDAAGQLFISQATTNDEARFLKLQPSDATASGQKYAVINATKDGVGTQNLRLKAVTTDVTNNVTVKGNVSVGGTLPSAPNTKLKSDGSATFSGSVSIGGTAAANTIDEYEEGTWTPTLSDFGSSSIPFTLDSSRYIRVGDVVTIQAVLTLTSASYGQVIKPVIGGLPYSPTARSLCQIVGTSSTNNTQGYTTNGNFIAKGNSSIQAGQSSEALVITSTYIKA